MRYKQNTFADPCRFIDYIMKLKQLIYLPIWAFRSMILDRRQPLQTVLFLTDYCNLRCKHCFEQGHACTMQKSFDQIRQELAYAYALGSRFLDLEGGEPTLWKEDGKDINDVIRLAKQIGFFTVTVTTNAQLPFDWVRADLIWVSLDGYGSYHDEIRGQGAFEKLDRNAAQFYQNNKNTRLGANIAVNRLNYPSVEDTIRYVKENSAFESIAVNFHTPYPGTEELCLTPEQRDKVIDRVIEMKKQGYPIQNSVSGLSIMKRKGFRKYCWISNFILTDGTRLAECPGKTLGICDDCGFSMAGEMYSVMHLKPDTFLSALKLRM